MFQKVRVSHPIPLFWHSTDNIEHLRFHKVLMYTLFNLDIENKIIFLLYEKPGELFEELTNLFGLSNVYQTKIKYPST